MATVRTTQEQMKKFQEDLKYFLMFFDLSNADFCRLAGWGPTTISGFLRKNAHPVSNIFIAQLEFFYNPYIFKEIIEMRGESALSKRKLENVREKINEILNKD